MNGALQPYRSASRNSGITDFALLPHGIIVLFRDGFAYLYTDETPGEEHLRNMRGFALAGRGLTTYINQNLRSRYAESLNAQQVTEVRRSM